MSIRFAARFDQGRVGVEAVIRQQDDARLEFGGFFDRERLRGDIALHRALLVGDERLRIEGVGLDLRLAETVFGFQPLEIARNAFLGHEQRQRLQVFEFGDLRFRMGQEDLRILLEDGGDRDHAARCWSTASKDCRVFALMKKSSLPAIRSMRLLSFGPPGTMVTSSPYFL